MINLDELNRPAASAVLDCIDLFGKITRTDLIQKTKNSPAGISNMVASFQRDGLIRECGQGYSFGGRKPTFLELNPDHEYIAVLRLKRHGTDKSRISLFIINLHCRLASSRHFTFSETGLAGAAGMVRDQLKEELQKFPVASIVATCSSSERIKVPAVTDCFYGVFLNEVCSVLNKDIDVIKCDAVNLSALAENRAYYSGEHSVLAYLDVGEDISLGVVDNGRIRGGDPTKPVIPGKCMLIMDSDFAPTYGDIMGTSGLFNYILPIYYKKYSHLPAVEGTRTTKTPSERLYTIIAEDPELYRAQLEKYMVRFKKAIYNINLFVQPDALILGGDSEWICRLASLSGASEAARALFAEDGVIREFSHYGDRGILIGAAKLSFLSRYVFK